MIPSGFKITKKRIVGDMNFPLSLVSTIKRIDWIKNRYNPNESNLYGVMEFLIIML